MATEESLRSRLIAAGAALVAERGAHGTTLREVARRAGVSHGAPRRYFPTHLALLSGIARQGFAQLTDLMAEVMADATATPHEKILELGRRYVRFAKDNRGMFELMFRHDLLVNNQLGLRDVSVPLFGALTALVAAASPGAHPERTAAALWPALHGIAQLTAWGSLPVATGLTDPEPLLRIAVGAFLGPDPVPARS
jgi:AcrR family transcriptional regulator